MDTSQNNNQVGPSQRYKKKAPSRGGFRKNAGRKKGSSEKLRASALLNAIHKVTGKPLAFLIAEHYQDSVDRGDWQAVRDYEKTFLSKVIADKVDVDHTTLGQSIHANFNFPQKELPDWNSIPKTITIDESN
jgi:hypothetical protein